MGVLRKYMIGEILRMLLPVWFGLGFLMFVLEWLSKVFSHSGKAGLILTAYLLKIPNYLQLVFPAAALFSCLAVLSSMNRSREVVAAQSIGLSRQKLLFPAVLALLFATIPYYFVSDVLMPRGMRKHWEIMDREVIGQPFRYGQVRQEKIWYRNSDVLYNVRYFDPDKIELFDVSIYTFDQDFQVAQVVYAKKAVWREGYWVLLDGSITVSDRRLETPVIEKFKERPTELIEEPKILKRSELEPEILSQMELKKAINRHKALGVNTSKWETVFQSRMSFYLISFVFLMLAFPTALRFNRGGGAAKDGIFVAIVCMAYWLFFNYSVNLGYNGKLNPIVAAWAPSIVTLIGVYLYGRSRTLQTESR